MQTRAKEKFEEVEHILRCSNNYFEILRLPAVETDPEVVKTQYKKLVLFVHPDKCKHPKADEAFKLLSNAFECLKDPLLQSDYLIKLQNSNQTRKRFYTPESTYYHFAKKRKEDKQKQSEAKHEKETTQEKKKEEKPKQEKKYYGWTYDSEVDAKKKQKQKHNEPSATTCNVCNRKFPSEAALKNHMRFADYNHRNLKKDKPPKQESINPKNLNIYDDL